jgi:hypothetical protein
MLSRLSSHGPRGGGVGIPFERIIHRPDRQVTAIFSAGSGLVLHYVRELVREQAQSIPAGRRELASTENDP